jgi:hypothetical protein
VTPDTGKVVSLDTPHRRLIVSRVSPPQQLVDREIGNTGWAKSHLSNHRTGRQGIDPRTLLDSGEVIEKMLRKESAAVSPTSARNLPRYRVEPIPNIDRCDCQNKRCQACLIVMPRRFVPNVVRYRVRPVAQASCCLG